MQLLACRIELVQNPLRLGGVPGVERFAELSGDLGSLAELVLGDVQGALAQLAEDQCAELSAGGVTQQALGRGRVLLELVGDLAYRQFGMPVAQACRLSRRGHRQ